MPKINVYLSDDLAEAVREASVPVSAICQQALARAVANAAAIKEVVAAPGQVGCGNGGPLTLRAGTAIRLASDDARRRQHPAVGTEHLLLGIVGEGQNLAVLVLDALEIDRSALEAELDRLLDSPCWPQPGLTKFGSAPSLAPAGSGTTPHTSSPGNASAPGSTPLGSTPLGSTAPFGSGPGNTSAHDSMDPGSTSPLASGPGKAPTSGPTAPTSMPPGNTSRIGNSAFGASTFGSSGPGSTAPADLSTTPKATDAVDRARQEALRMGHNYVGCEHLLLGLISEPAGMGGRVLRSMGAELTLARRAVTSVLNGYSHARRDHLVQPAAPDAGGDSVAAPARPDNDSHDLLQQILVRLDHIEGWLNR